MKRLTVRSCALSVATVLCLAALRLSAQTAAPTEGQTKEESAEAPMVLSPFVVEATEDSGYQANSTLAGTRVRTDLKDISSSISVVTKQFLQDTGAKNSLDLLGYTPNTEVGGLRGNFSGQAGNPQYNEPLVNPNNNTRVRGLDAADNTRDYFLTDIPWDGFNVDRVDLQRGPNSILFGVGSPAGIINTSVNDASFKTAYKYENVVSRYGGFRNVIDLNYAILPNQLAFRFAVLSDDQKFQQDPAFNKSTRYYGAVRFDPKLFNKEGAHTQIRAKYEDGKVRSNNPRTIPPVDEISPWFDRLHGLTSNQYIPGQDSSSAFSAANFYSTSASGGWKQGRSYWPDVLSYFNGNNPQQQASTTVSNVATNVITPMINTGFAINSNGLPAGSQANGIGGLPNFGPVGIPAYSLYAANTASIPGGSYYADKVISDPSVFDFYNNLLDGDNKQEWQDWTALNAAISQTFFHDRVGLELVADHQDYDNGQITFLDGVNHAISLDVNETFADGTHNPNVGRPYVANAASYGNASNHVIRDSLRFTATGELRFEDFMGKSTFAKILGRHVFTGLWNHEERKSQSMNWVRYATTADWPTWGNIPVNTQTTNRQFDWVDYLGPSLVGASSAANAHISRITNIIAPTQTSVVTAFNSHWNKPTDPNAPGYVNPAAPYTLLSYSTGLPLTNTQAANPLNYVGWQQVPVTWESWQNPSQFPDLVTSGQKLHYKNISKGITWQGYFLEGDLVPVFGWRKDSVENWSTPAPLDPMTGIASSSYEEDPASLRSATGESKSWGGVYHLPRAIMSKVPWGTSLSVFYNRSQNFKADAPRQNLFGQTIANPSGNTEEYGFTFSTMDDKLALRVAWFDTKVANATFNVTNGNSIAGLGGNGYYMWAAPTWGFMYASAVEATLDNLPGATNGNYAAADGVVGANDPGSAAFQNAPETALSKQIVDAWLHIPVPSNFFTYYGIHPQTYDLSKANGKIRNAISNWTVNSVNNTGSQQPGGISAVSTVDTLSKGTEYELVAQPTKNWNVSVNYSRTTATKENIDSATVQFMTDLHAFFTGVGGQLRLWGQTGTAIGPQWVQNVYNPYLVSVLAQGQSAPEVAPWRLNGITTYSFDHGRLRGGFVGGGIRMEAGKILGYAYDPSTGSLDVNKQLIGPDDTHFDLWFGYAHKLGSSKVHWRVQLNFRDVGEKSHLVPARYEPDGTLALQRIQQGMTWALTNSFEF